MPETSLPQQAAYSRAPSITVAMPVFNGGQCLRLAVLSIIGQTFRNWELLIIDDGSTDNALQDLADIHDCRIRILRDGKNRGLAVRLNQAINLARGEYFARMDADDICYPERFKRQVAMLESRPDIDLLGSGAIVFNGSGQAMGRLPLRLEHAEICKRPWAGFYLAHPTWMGRTEWFKKYSYRQDVLRAQDQDLLLRTYRHSHFAALPDILLGYRQESVSLSPALRGRYHFSRALFRQMIEGGDWQLIRGLIEQPLKALIDTFAVATGLNYRLLRHRAMPIDEKARAEWEGVWAATNILLSKVCPQLAINRPKG